MDTMQDIHIRLQPNGDSPGAAGFRLGISREDGNWDDLGQFTNVNQALLIAGATAERRLNERKAIDPAAVSAKLQEGLDQSGYAKVDLREPAAEKVQPAGT